MPETDTVEYRLAASCLHWVDKYAEPDAELITAASEVLADLRATWPGWGSDDGWVWDPYEEELHLRLIVALHLTYHGGREVVLQELRRYQRHLNDVARANREQPAYVGRLWERERIGFGVHTRPEPVPVQSATAATKSKAEREG